MKAALFHDFKKPLAIEEFPDPVLRPNGAIVRILSFRIASYTGRVFAGELSYAMPDPFPFIPGPSAVGVVEQVSDDVFGIKPGEIVYMDSLVASRSPGVNDDAILIAWTGLKAESKRMQSLWRNGTFAEKALWPAECLTSLKGAESFDPGVLGYLIYFMIAHGGLLRGGFRSGQSLVVNGATGGIGTAAILVSLAMGASKIVAVGRDQGTLNQLREIDPKRITAVSLSKDVSTYTEEIRVAGEEADMMLDALGSAPTPDPTLACLNAIRSQGTAVFVGGVKVDIPLPYSKVMLNELTIRGSFMYPKDTPAEIWRMITSGVLRLDVLRPHIFSLDKINEAIRQASEMKGVHYCVVVP